MSKVIVNGHFVEPLGVQKIIKGVIKEVQNPITKEITQVGDGEVLWDISQTRHSPSFVLCRKTKSFNS